MYRETSAKNSETERLDPFPMPSLFIEIIIDGLWNLSFILPATIPITPSCHSVSAKTMTFLFEMA